MRAFIDFLKRLFGIKVSPARPWPPVAPPTVDQPDPPEPTTDGPATTHPQPDDTAITNTPDTPLTPIIPDQPVASGSAAPPPAPDEAEPREPVPTSQPDPGSADPEGNDPPPPVNLHPGPVPPDPEPVRPTAKTIVPLLIYPRLESGEDAEIGATTDARGKSYFIAAPWEVDHRLVSDSIEVADAWLTQALNFRIPWNPLGVVRSQHTLEEWRQQEIYLLESEVRELGWPWEKEYV